MADYAIHDTTLIGTSSIIRKKEGSSALIDPADYPKRINLMGMLEEKSASSASVCSFSDGADDVPMSSVVAHIAPTLTGTNAVNMVQIPSNNLMSIADADFTLNSVRYHTVNGILYVNGESTGETSSNNDAFKALSFTLPKGTYYFTRASHGIASYIRKMSDKSEVRVNNGSFTLTETTELYIAFYVHRQTFDNEKFDQIINVGSSAITYEDTGAKTDYTANLGRTVYGADVDLVSGQGSETYGYIDLGSLTWVKVTSGQTPYFSASSALNPAYKWASQNSNVLCNNYSYASIGSSGSDEGFFITNASYVRIRDANYESMTADQFKTAISGTVLVYETATGTDFTFDGQEIPSLLGVNNLLHEDGNTEAVYRSSGTVTPVPVVPTLISKTITENGTYSAEDDDADGYSEVTVNVQGGETPFVPEFSETLIGDNTAHASSFTLTEDYGNYDMVKIVWWESASSSGFLYTTPDILDEIFSVGAGKLCINKPSTNYYVCYTKNGLTWTQTNQRNIYVHEVYGVTFTNCTMTATDLYKRGASTTTRYAITSQTSLKDYDLFMMSSIHNTDGSETMPTNWLYQYPPENMSEAFSCPVPTVLQEYNANDEAFVISEYGMTSARYFMVQGIKFTQTPSLLSMSPAPVSQEESEEEEE